MNDFIGLFGFLDGGEDLNWEELKKLGKITERVVEENGFKCITKTFVSKDGNQIISETSTEPILNKKENQLKFLEEQIQTSIENEDYEGAAKLKIVKDQLLKNKNK